MAKNYLSSLAVFITLITITITTVSVGRTNASPMPQISAPEPNPSNNNNNNHFSFYAPATTQQLQLQLHQTNPMQLQTTTTTLTSTFNPYTKAINELLLDLRQHFLTRAFKFDEHFRRLVTTSKISLHTMFEDTYGTHYNQNVDIFTGMFHNLEQYYATGQININHQTISSITKSMEHFFDKLYQIIFKVFSNNSARPTTPRFLECATEQLAHLRPFRDIPDKLIDEIRHAFVAARTFNQALNLGIDVIKNIISVSFLFMIHPIFCSRTRRS